MKPVDAATVFSDNFSTGNLDQWSQSYVISGANQIVSNGVARFIAPPPVAGASTHSYVVKDGFTSTVNSTIVASQDVFVTNVPTGSSQGNGAIFFLYVCDSSNLAGNYGNVGVGIDGSTVWSMWIGGNVVYRYVFQTAGSAPVSNTWYHLVLTINNPAETVSLAVNGVTVITASQQQFTDKNHPISFMSGLGENWWSAGSEPQELHVDNVRLELSDSAALPAPVSTSSPPPASTSTPAHTPLPLPTQRPIVPTQTPILTPTPIVTNVTSAPSFSPPPLNPALSVIQPSIGVPFEVSVVGVTVLVVLVFVLVATLRSKR